MSYELGAALTLTYAWLKAGHVIFVIFWIAGLFMLPRFYVYHQESAPGSDEEQRWIDRERKLRKIIINPAMILVWVLGLWMAWRAGWWSAGWFQAKLVLVALLTCVHHLFALWRKDFEADRNVRPAKHYRLWNEVPTLIMIGIVFLVVLKPF